MYGFDPTTVTVVTPLDGEEFLTSVDVNTQFDGHDMAISYYIAATKNS